MSSIPAGLLPAYAAVFAMSAASLLQLHPSAQNIRDTWTVVMHVSGGFAGLDREIRVGSSGAVTATDRRRQVSATASMPAAALADVDAIVSRLAASQASKPPSRCRDCLLYRFEIKRTTAAVTAEFDDLTIAGTPFELLAKTLTTQLTETLQR